MKVSSFFALLFTGMALAYISCNSGENKTTTDTTTVKPEEPAVVNTIVTTPQTMMVVRHKVKSFAAWFPAYEAHDSVRLKYGLHSYVVSRALDDSNMVMVALKAEDADKALAFGKDPSLKTAMQKGGVVGTPTINLNTIVWQDTVNVGGIPRVLTELTVKDWDTWKTKFAEGKQERKDNGIVDRQYGHDVKDNHKVSLVTALTDTAKAFAYWKSDALKKRREESGVVGEPKRFIFKIAKRY